MTIQEYLDRENITFWLIGGTLLGAIREKDFLYWDDDIDVMIDEDDLQIFKEKCIPELKKYNIDSLVFQNIPRLKYKLCDLRNKKIKGYNYSWPFIDIFVYKKPPISIRHVTEMK